MAFRAVHAQWGTVLAYLPDLGCGRAWSEVWKVRPRAPLSCDECGHGMYAKVSHAGLPFFAHDPAGPRCALALEESPAHHMLKLELANAARDAGAQAEMEAPGPGGTWRADVLATDPAGAWSIALEAQLAPITATEISRRTTTMAADGVSSCWFSDRARPPWLGAVPSIRLARQGDRGPLMIAEGLARFQSNVLGMAVWEQVQDVTLVQFLSWAFTGRIVAHKVHRRTIWTAPRYAVEEASHRAAMEEAARRHQAEVKEVARRHQEKLAELALHHANQRKERLAQARAQAAGMRQRQQQQDVSRGAGAAPAGNPDTVTHLARRAPIWARWIAAGRPLTPDGHPHLT